MGKLPQHNATHQQRIELKASALPQDRPSLKIDFRGLHIIEPAPHKNRLSGLISSGMRAFAE